MRPRGCGGQSPAEGTPGLRLPYSAAGSVWPRQARPRDVTTVTACDGDSELLHCPPGAWCAEGRRPRAEQGPQPSSRLSLCAPPSHSVWGGRAACRQRTGLLTLREQAFPAGGAGEEGQGMAATRSHRVPGTDRASASPHARRPPSLPLSLISRQRFLLSSRLLSVPQFPLFLEASAHTSGAARSTLVLLAVTRHPRPGFSGAQPPLPTPSLRHILPHFPNKLPKEAAAKRPLSWPWPWPPCGAASPASNTERLSPGAPAAPQITGSLCCLLRSKSPVSKTIGMASSKHASRSVELDRR